MPSERTPVDSRNLEAVRYDRDGQVLEIRFRQGGEYRYAAVPPDVYDEMMGAESVGKTFNRLIRGKYETEKIAP